jgi:acyl-CoA dehydrogenase
VDLESDEGGHAEVEIKDLVVPHKNILGDEGEGFNMGQLRLGYGRLRHGFHNIATAQKALDLAVGRVITRTTFGQPLAERQGILWMLADCARDLYLGRLMVLHIAYLIQQKKDFTQENHIAKVFLANMVTKCIDTAIQVHGALGLTKDTPLMDMYIGTRSQHIVDGPDEVHRWRAGANLVKAFKQYGITASSCGGELGI